MKSHKKLKLQCLINLTRNVPSSSFSLVGRHPLPNHPNLHLLVLLRLQFLHLTIVNLLKFNGGNNEITFKIIFGQKWNIAFPCHSSVSSCNLILTNRCEKLQMIRT